MSNRCDSIGHKTILFFDNKPFAIEHPINMVTEYKNGKHITTITQNIELIKEINHDHQRDTCCINN